jgi:predicted polyphosphate/ATP-dependent NAD kinase
VTIVGIIANPASGKDIRRLIAHGSVFDNQEKVSIVRRVLLGLQATGVDQVVCMPDSFGIGQRAVESVELSLAFSTLDMSLQANQDDSTLAARLMRERGVGAIVTLGGDGTNRAVAKTSETVPIMPISTGTNNVFPQMIEGTVAGLAAGLVARGQLPLEETTRRQLRLDVRRDGQLLDIALIDVVVYAESFIGARAVWDMAKVREIVLTQASPSNIGLSSIGGGVFCAQLDRQHGVYLRLNDGHGLLELTAAIAPGLIEQVQLSQFRLLRVGDEVEVGFLPAILALDGEREVAVREGERVTVALSDRGPVLIDMRRTMQAAARHGLLARPEAQVALQASCMLRAVGLCVDPPEQCLREFAGT